MIVVCDTSPLTNLAAIGRFDLLQRCFGTLYIADAVWDELHAGDARHPGRTEVETESWIRRRSVENRPLVQALRRDLDAGESETIALAIELNAAVALIDEREARRAAARFGIRVLGVLGILLDAKARGYIGRIRPSLDALRNDAGFYLSADLYHRVLDLANKTT